MYRMIKTKVKVVEQVGWQVIFFSLIFCILVSCSDQKEKEAAEFFGRGVYHLKKNELDDAERFFNEALGKKPELADAHNNLGLIHELRGDFKQAVADFERASAIDPTFSQARFNQARVLSYLREYAIAERLFQSVATEYKDSVNFYIERGQLFVNDQRIEAGVADFAYATQLSPENSKALTNLGYAYILLNDFVTAESKLTQAISYNPNEATAHNNLAFLYGITNKEDKALSAAKFAVKLDPNNNVFRNNLGYSYLINNELDAAKAEFDLVKSSLVENAYYLRNVGVLSFKRGDFAAADKLLQQAEETDPSTFLIYYYLGKNSLGLKQTERAISYFTTGSRLSDNLSQRELSKLTNSQ